MKACEPNDRLCDGAESRRVEHEYVEVVSLCRAVGQQGLVSVLWFKLAHLNLLHHCLNQWSCLLKVIDEEGRAGLRVLLHYNFGKCILCSLKESCMLLWPAR